MSLVQGVQSNNANSLRIACSLSFVKYTGLLPYILYNTAQLPFGQRSFQTKRIFDSQQGGMKCLPPKRCVKSSEL